MKKNVNQLSIAVTLDSIFDVRQGILHTLMDKDEWIKYIASEEYLARDIDDFPVDMDKYNAELETVSLDHIKDTTITYGFNTLYQRFQNLVKSASYDERIKRIVLVVITEPYIIPERLAKIFQNAIFHKLKLDIEIEFCNLPYSKLSVPLLESMGVQELFIYRFSEWMSHHVESVQEKTSPSMVVNAPALYKEIPSLEESKKVEKVGYQDFFSFIETTFSPFISINFQPVFVYCNHITASLYVKKMGDIVRAKEQNKPHSHRTSSSDDLDEKIDQVVKEFSDGDKD